MAFTFAELKTAIQNYTENSETTFVSSLPTFIRAAEDRIFKLVDLTFFRKNVSASMTASNKFLQLPSDYLSSFSISITNSGSKEFLLQRDVNFLQEAYPNSSSTATPRYYAYFDVNNLLIAPTPDANYSSDLHYYYRPPSLTAGADSGTTWVSENAPNALLYGSLFEAYVYMKGEADMVQVYEKQFVEAVERVKDLAEGRENSDAYERGLPDRPRT